MLKTRELAYLPPTKDFSWPRPDMVMLFALFKSNHSPSSFSAHAEPISKGHCRIWHPRAESLM